MGKELVGVQKREYYIQDYIYNNMLFTFLILCRYSRLALPMSIPAQMKEKIPFIFLDGELW